MNFINKFFIKLSAKNVGCDEFGNQYFQDKNNKRFVIYRGIAEPSKISDEWYGWLHHTKEVIPSANHKKYFWQKISLPNLTGTKYAHFSKDALTRKQASNYQSWKP